MLSATTFQGYKKCCMLAMDVWCFSKSTARIDLEKHQTRLHYWGISLCNFGESPLQFWVFLLYTKHCKRALLYSRTPSYKSIKNLLAAMKENPESASQDSDQLSSGSQAHGITRGARYYGGKKS